MKIREHSSQKNKRGHKAKQDGKDVSEISFTELLSKLEETNWGKDVLSKNIKAAFFNIGVSFLELRPYCECLIKAAEIFEDAIKLLSHSDLKGLISISLFARAYGCFFGAVRLSFSGQITETWVLLRACIENSLYAFYIAENPEYATIWTERCDSEAHKKKCREVFAIGKIWKALEAKSKSITKEARNCYEDTIDWGAHPNELTVFSNLEEKQDGSGYNMNILNPNEVLMRHSLCAVLSTVSIVFKIFALIYPDEFKQPNLTVKIDNLNKQAKMLFYATSKLASKAT
ncbi:MAG: hypothetical protein FVQ80_02560 [Planctomycetes bacterium]|nr:hypothetical protein [Planctomycetota bacterium]